MENLAVQYKAQAINHPRIREAHSHYDRANHGN